MHFYPAIRFQLQRYWSMPESCKSMQKQSNTLLQFVGHHTFLQKKIVN